VSEFDFDREVSASHMKAAGWEMNDFNHSNPFNCHMFYIVDYRTGHVQVLTISKDDFELLKPEHSPEELGGGLGEIVMRLHANAATERDHQVLLPLLGGYIKATSSYRQWLRVSSAHERLHAFINFYPAPRGTSQCRPFMARSTAAVMHAEDVLRTSMNVHDTDRANHPEWFDESD
jgi:hypothetical protein